MNTNHMFANKAVSDSPASTAPGIRSSLDGLENIITALEKEVSTLADRSAPFRLIAGGEAKAKESPPKMLKSDYETYIDNLAERAQKALSGLIVITDSIR